MIKPSINIDKELEIVSYKLDVDANLLFRNDEIKMLFYETTRHDINISDTLGLMNEMFEKILKEVSIDGHNVRK